MTYKEWVTMNIEYESTLLERIHKEHGKTSKQYKKKLGQITGLKEDLK